MSHSIAELRNLQPCCLIFLDLRCKQAEFSICIPENTSLSVL